MDDFVREFPFWVIVVFIFLILLLIALFIAFIISMNRSEKRKNILHDLYHKYQKLERERNNLKANLEKASNENIKLRKVLDEFKLQYPDFNPSINVEEDSQSAVTEETQPTSTEGPKSKEEVSQSTEEKDEPPTNSDDSIPPVEYEPSPTFTFDLNNKSESVKYYYLKDAYKGKFPKKFTEPTGCYFRCWEKDGKLLYEFCGDQEKAIKNVNAYFDDVCILKGVNPYQANAIVNVEPGILDENLNVIERAVINLVSK